VAFFFCGVFETMSKRQIIFWLVLVAIIGFRGWFLPESKTRTILQAQSLPAVPSQITVPFMASPNTVISSSERNANDTALRDGVNAVRDWLNSAYNNIFALDEDETIAGNNTHTGNNTFTMTVTISGGLDLTGTYNQINFTSDGANSSSERAQCHQFNRGSTSTNKPGICWDPTTGRLKTSQNGTGGSLQEIDVAAPTQDSGAANRLYSRTLPNGVIAITSQTWDLGGNRLQNIAQGTASTDALRKDQADALTVGTCVIGAGAPTGSCTYGACYVDFTDNNNPKRWECNSSMAWVKTDIDTIDLNLTVNNTSTLNGATALNGNITLGMSITFDGGGVVLMNVGTPSTGTDVVNKDYADSKTSPIFGDGSDGTTAGICNITSSTTLTRDIYCTTFTISNSAVLNPGGYKIFSTGDCNIQAGTKIQRNGNNASGMTGGSALAAGSIPGGLAGTDGGVAGNGNSPCNSDLTAGMAGTNATTIGGQGTAGTSVSTGNCSPGTNTISSNLLRDYFSATIWKDWASGTLAPVYSYTGNCGGGGGASECNVSCSGGNGGGSGSQGGNAFLACKNLILNGTIELMGGIGGDGGSCVCSMSYPGAGGPPGDGGIATLIYNTKSGTGMIDVSTGTPGMSGPACGGSANNDGPAGMAGFVIEIMGA